MPKNPHEHLPQGWEEPLPMPPVPGEIDPTSVQGHPGYIGPDEFAEQLGQHTDSPSGIEGERIVQSELAAAGLWIKTQRAQTRCFHGAIALTLAMMSRGVYAIVDAMDQGDPPPLTVELAHHASAAAAILGAAMMTGTTIMATIYGSRARKIEEQIADAAGPTADLE